MAGDKNRRCGDVLFPQPRDQVQSRNSGHSLVDDQAAAVAIGMLVQQLGAARIEPDDETLDFERELERIAHSRVIVNDDDDGPGSRQIGLCIHCSRLHGWIAVLEQKARKSLLPL
jgi:hypothetical protein